MLNISPKKKKIIQLLFGLAVLMLAANIVAAKYIAVNKPGENDKIDTNFVNNEFLNDLNKFGLKNEWIKKIKGSKNQGLYLYNVELPKDLPVPVVLSQINGSFLTLDYKINSYEKNTGGKTILEIYPKSFNKKLLTAEFDYNSNIIRDAGNLGIIVFGLERLKPKNINSLVMFPQTFMSVLVPSKASVQLIPEIIGSKKEYAVLLNDDISDSDYKLNGDFSDYRLKLSIRSLAGTFTDSVYFIIDDHSKLYSSHAFKVIKDEFAKRKIKLIPRIALPYTLNRAQIKDDFRNIVEKTRLGKTNLIAVSAEDFETIEPEIFSLIKVGYKFINPSRIMFAGNTKLGLK